MSEQVPDYCEPILAYRVWRVSEMVRVSTEDPTPRPSVLRLLSMLGRIRAWEPYQRFEARHEFMGSWQVQREQEQAPCTASPCDGHKPGVSPKCGIYGFKTREDLREEWRGPFIPHPTVVGAVWLWGRIAVHERGYRAQYAYPAHFIYGQDCDAAALAREYGVPYKEDPTWKSADPFDALFRSHWKNLSLSVFTPPIVPPQIVPNIVPLRSANPSLLAPPSPFAITLQVLKDDEEDQRRRRREEERRLKADFVTSILNAGFKVPTSVLRQAMNGHMPTTEELQRDLERMAGKPPDDIQIVQPEPVIHPPRRWFYDAPRRLWRRIRAWGDILG